LEFVHLNKFWTILDVLLRTLHSLHDNPPDLQTVENQKPNPKPTLYTTKISKPKRKAPERKEEEEEERM
jgi:hypothetical protein